MAKRFWIADVANESGAHGDQVMVSGKDLDEEGARKKAVSATDSDLVQVVAIREIESPEAADWQGMHAGESRDVPEPELPVVAEVPAELLDPPTEIPDPPIDAPIG